MGQARKVTFTRESSKRIKRSEESHSDPNENLPMKNRKLEAALRGMGTSQAPIRRHATLWPPHAIGPATIHQGCLLTKIDFQRPDSCV
jgi:hypothetical protein